MNLQTADFENVTQYSSSAGCFPCNPCSPDQRNDDGSQCYPCNPCSPDRLGKYGSQCSPCNPCSPDQRNDDGSQCYPCNPCSPDRAGAGGSQCSPCNPCSPDQSNGSYGGSDGCFISSACTESCGLPDNCDELRTLRAFRDKRRLYDEKFDLLVKEYYRIAPRIVDKIEKSSDAKAEYARLYHELVTPCVAMIKANRENDAVKLYISTVLELKKAYLGMA